MRGCKNGWLHVSLVTRIDRSAVSPLENSFSGRLLLPDDDGYETARRVHNGMIDRHPAIIACCLQTADVVNALEFSIHHDLEIAVRGGGHNVAGRAVIDDGMMIDLSPMKGIGVDPTARSVRVQPGVTWGEFNQETQLHGLATTGGAVSSTGVAGLTLGSGFGFLMGQYGLPSSKISNRFLSLIGSLRMRENLECMEALHLLLQLRDLLLQAGGLGRARQRLLLPIDAVELVQIAGDALLDLRHAPFMVYPREFLVAAIYKVATTALIAMSAIPPRKHTPTRCPTVHPSTPSPSMSITPTASCPGTRGHTIGNPPSIVPASE
jgi:FAD binding domain